MKNELIIAILSNGGVDIPPSINDRDSLLCLLESWLGLPTSDSSFETDMMEDGAPFDVAMYKALEALLLSVWKTDETGTQMMIHANPLLEIDCDPNDMSLYKAMEVVRVTRLLRYWMELNVQGHINESNKGLSDILLENCTEEKSEKARRYPLIEAVYHHIENLPQLQSQIYFYTQSIMREKNPQNSGQVLLNPQSRLLRYQEMQTVSSRLNAEWEEHVERLEYIIGEWYLVGNVDIRRQSRSHLGSVWSQFVLRSGTGVAGMKMENTSSSGICMSLRVLYRILSGCRERLERSHEYLLIHHLLPLHQPSSMVLWRDQTSLLELYHEPLVKCIAILLQKRPQWVSMVISAMLEPEIWTKGGNTPKLVLLLHEIDTYIGILPESLDESSISPESFSSLLRTLGSCMASDHSRLAERALSFMKNKKFQSLVQIHYERSLSTLLPFLVRSEPAWNPTVRKMTYTVLKSFQDFDEIKFRRISDKCFPNGESSPKPSSTSLAAPLPKRTGTVKLQSTNNTIKPNDFTLKSAMGGWKPPQANSSTQNAARNLAMPPPSSRVPRRAPPLAVTGVAPWSMSRNTQPRRTTVQNPPLGVTGVAPWAIQQMAPLNAKRSAGEALSTSTEGKSTENDEQTKPSQEHASRVLSYMKSIKPPEEEEGVSSWAKAQMAETPTLLPNLKFHDLVFGHDLGEGAFGSVRYARLIDRTRTRSQWPEYAVKIISTEKIKEMGYEANVQRELAVLTVLSHPSIARLVSSFRFREGVYLVLEYASGGDLHSLLRKNGSLDHASTRFLMGEVVAALASIHEIGFVYADLKPENIVITEEGHAKLTDFGGCRAVTKEAKESLGIIAINLLSDLRDGDWKPKMKKKGKLFDLDEDEEDSMADDNLEAQHHPDNDLRIEGTTAYLPPEVVMGGFPTFAADSWALGCVLYQCLSGRPPIIEDDEAMTKSRIVSFDARQADTSTESQLFGGRHAAGIDSDARDLIISLLNKISPARPSMAEAAQHGFFVNGGIDVFSLHRQQAPPLDVGEVSPVEDAKWSRRQFSSIWAPQPQAYDISSITTESRSYKSTIGTNGPIPEGDEATAFFSKAGSIPRDLHNRGSVPLPSLKRPIKE